MKPLNQHHSTKLARVVATLAMLSGLAVRSEAGTVVASFDSLLSPTAIELNVGDSAGWVSTEASAFNFTHLGGTDPKFLYSNFIGFCIEPGEFVSYGTTYTYDLLDLENGTSNIGGMGTTKANLLRELYGRYMPDFTASVPATTIQAIQIAVWEIVREASGTLDVAAGNVQFRNPGDPGALTLAQTYLSSLDGNGPKLNNLYALVIDGTQDVVVQVNVPETGTFLSMGIGLLVVSVLFRRSTRTVRH